MNFLESLKTCYKKVFNYRGRASKSEYWWFKLYFTLFAILTFYIVETHTFGQVLFVLWVFNNLPLLSAAVRRFHDMNKSGWLVLWSLVPFIGAFIVLIMLAGDGTKGKNKFGPKPKK